jgi:hypothetical protein
MDSIATRALLAEISAIEEQEYVARTRVNDVHLGRTDTPLCSQFFLNGYRHGMGTPTCKGCPVAEAGHPRCGGTALSDAVDTMRSMVTQEDVGKKKGLLAERLREHLKFLRGLAARGSEMSR